MGDRIDCHKFPHCFLDYLRWMGNGIIKSWHRIQWFQPFFLPGVSAICILLRVGHIFLQINIQTLSHMQRYYTGCLLASCDAAKLCRHIIKALYTRARTLSWSNISYWAKDYTFFQSMFLLSENNVCQKCSFLYACRYSVQERPRREI